MNDASNIQLNIIDYFLATNDNSQIFFEKIVKTALHYKHNFDYKPLNGEDITKAIFNLPVKDKITLNNKIVNGQRLSELFIVSIYLKYLCQQIYTQNQTKNIFIAIPEEEKDYDIVVIIDELSSKNLIDKKYHISEKSVQLYFQVKEVHEHADKEKEKSCLKKFNEKELTDTINKYPDKDSLLFLFYSRKSSEFNTLESDKFLLNNQNIAYIGNLKEIKQQNSIIKLNNNKFNFFILKGDQKVTISFDIPKYFSKN